MVVKASIAGAIVTYALGMLFSLKTHREAFASAGTEGHDDDGEPWPIGLALVVLACVTLLVALVSEIFVGSVQHAAISFGMTPVFVGFVVVALVGGAAEMSSAFSAARKNRLDLSVSSALGSASQIALFVAPVLLLAPQVDRFQESGLYPWGEPLLVNLVMFRDAGLSSNSAMDKKATQPRRSKKPIPKANPEAPAPQPSAAFPIVGIGASAGGLEALEQFLQRVPAGSGMAFVIVQHLDPTRKGLMAELLQRCTPMKVMQVKDCMRVKPDCVYVIPPNKDMSILHGVLHLFETAGARGLRLPIDYFLRSLAQDQQQSGIGVILSGMGSDGTLGLRDIKEKAGLVLAQEPSSAKFDSMPRSVIDAGLADIVAPADELPEKIMTFLKRTPLITDAGLVVDEKLQDGLEKILILLRTRVGHDFSFYKNNTLYRRIERRMGIHQIDKIAGYVRYLQENPQELDLLFKEMLIGVTSFFRDPEVWQLLREETIPALLASPPAGTLRAWVAGCSTGEEAYSLAIVFKEAMEKLGPQKSFKLQIFASDLDRDAIDKARQGLFPENISADVSADRLHRYFTKEDSGYRIRAEIREMVVFSPHSLIMDPPFTKLDLLSCRNLLIYLTQEMQKKLFPLFHYCLQPGGILVLGSAETIGQFTDLFSTVDGKCRIFRRTETILRPESAEFPSSFAPRTSDGHGAQTITKTTQNLQTLAEQLILHRFSPPSVLTTEKGDILHISGRTGQFLEPAAGKANWNIFAMARDGLRYELTAAFQKALKQKGSVILKDLKIRTDGGERYTNISIEKLPETDPLRGMVMIVFTEIPVPAVSEPSGKPAKAPQGGQRLTELEHELQQARAELQSTREEMQSSHEELRSTNEELQSTNEEMQSTNEELTTSKEEMQSLNEEMQTVNSELQSKIEELSRSNNDMKNLLNSTDIATLFLDKNLLVRRFTTEASKIINLIPGDIGRPITDLSSDLIYPALPADAHDVLRKLGSSEKPISISDGRWFTVRIMPYRTLDDRIDGVVITFWDISIAKALEVKMQDIQDGLEERLAKQTTRVGKQIEPRKPAPAKKSAGKSPRNSKI
ncbi:MAG: protein glutamate methylesterase CheB and methyltransferase CheR [Verrucomicrobiota bacterium]|jgi:two-component system CheB/CheR fusion protein